MQLRNARLCLDCEEMHEEQQCPVCASESFAFVSRWVPAEERRRNSRPRPRVVESPSPPGRKSWIAGGLAGVALFAASRWLLQPNRPADGQAPGEPEPQDD